jgi:DNA-binding NarL/FixJ family response regulator
MNSKHKIFIVDDNRQFVEGLDFLLKKDPAFEIIGTAYNSNELFQNPKFKLADIILLDIEMPGMNGFDTASKINWTNASIKMIAITMYQEKVYLEKLVNSGFRGFVNKTEITECLIDVIHKVADNNFVFPGNIEIN